MTGHMFCMVGIICLAAAAACAVIGGIVLFNRYRKTAKMISQEYGKD